MGPSLLSLKKKLLEQNDAFLLCLKYQIQLMVSPPVEYSEKLLWTLQIVIPVEDRFKLTTPHKVICIYLNSRSVIFARRRWLVVEDEAMI